MIRKHPSKALETHTPHTLPRKRRRGGAKKLFRMLVALVVCIIGIATGGFGLEPNWSVSVEMRQLVASVADEMQLDPLALNSLLAQSDQPTLPVPVPLARLLIHAPPINSSIAANALNATVSGWVAAAANAVGISTGAKAPIADRAVDLAASAQAIQLLADQSTLGMAVDRTLAPIEQRATAQALTPPPSTLEL